MPVSWQQLRCVTQGGNQVQRGGHLCDAYRVGARRRTGGVQRQTVAVTLFAPAARLISKKLKTVTGHEAQPRVQQRRSSIGVAMRRRAALCTRVVLFYSRIDGQVHALIAKQICNSVVPNRAKTPWLLLTCRLHMRPAALCSGVVWKNVVTYEPHAQCTMPLPHMSLPRKFCNLVGGAADRRRHSCSEHRCDNCSCTRTGTIFV